MLESCWKKFGYESGAAGTARVSKCRTAIDLKGYRVLVFSFKKESKAKGRGREERRKEKEKDVNKWVAFGVSGGRGGESFTRP